jgi:sporulation protein YlmC with PRC-barrel domain
MIANRQMDGIENLIIRHGVLTATHDHLLPLTYVVAGSEEGVHVNLDQAAFEALDQFTEAGYHAHQVHYTAPTEAKDRFETPGEFHTDVMASQGYRGFLDRKVGGYPGGEQIVPDDQQLPLIRLGMDVLDVTGEKLGELGELVVRVEDGMPVRISLSEGFIFKQSHNPPIDWIKEFAVDGIVLNVGRQEVEAREHAA